MSDNPGDNVGLSEADLASVVQQAMDGLHNDQLYEAGDLSNGQNNNTNDDDNDNDFKREIERQLEFQQQGQSENHEPRSEAQNTAGDDKDDDFAAEVERQLQEQLNHQEQQPQPQTMSASDSSRPVSDLKEPQSTHIDDQNVRFDLEMENHIRQELNLPKGYTVSDSNNNSITTDNGDGLGKTDEDGVKNHKVEGNEAVDYEKELQRQIMDVLGDQELEQKSQQAAPNNQAVDDKSLKSKSAADRKSEVNIDDLENDLQRQIMDAFNANENRQREELDNSQPPSSQHIREETPVPAPQSLTAAGQQSYSQVEALQQVQTQHQTQSHDVKAEDDYELQLQKQIMDAFNAVDETQAEIDQSNTTKKSTATDTDTDTAAGPSYDANYEQELQNQILEAFNDQQQPNDVPVQPKSQLATFDDHLLKDALAELVQNVVDQQADVTQQPPLQQGQSQQLLQQQLSQLQPQDQPSNDDDEIDMNQIMQNALAMAVEDPNALLQSLNLGNQDNNAVLGMLLQQGQIDSSQQPVSGKAAKKKATKQAKEKKPPKEKKPRAPRKTTKKKKEKPMVSQIPIFQQSTPYPTVPLQVPQLQQFQQIPGTSSNLAPVSQISINQQPIAVPPVLQQQVAQLQQQQQQKLLFQLQEAQKAQAQQQADLASSAASSTSIPDATNASSSKVTPSVAVQATGLAAPSLRQIKQPQVPIPPTTHQAASTSSSTVKEVKQPRPAPANSIIDSVKKIPPLVLLSKDTSIDLANSVKKKKQSLSIAETLALSRSNMSSGKFFSKLQDSEKEKEDQSKSVPSTITPAAPPQRNVVPVSQLPQPKPIAGNAPVTSDEKKLEATSKAEKTTIATPPSLPIAANVQGNAIINNISSVLPDLPSNLTELISKAIHSALSTNPVANQQREIVNKPKKKLVVENETPEQQKERVRIENRERKKRWRDANRLKNQNNDLRARLKKRAIQLFGPDDSAKKTEWIETEFEKRKNRRIIRSANLEDLTLLISETMSKVDFQNLNQEALTKLISQIVTSALSPAEKSTDSSKSTPEPSKSSDMDLGAVDPSLTQPPLTVQSSKTSSTSTGVVPVTAASASATAKAVPVVPPKPKLPKLLNVAKTVPAPVKRKNDALSNFDFKRIKIPLIPLSVRFDDSVDKDAPTERVKKVEVENSKTTTKPVEPDVKTVAIQPPSSVKQLQVQKPDILKLNKPRVTKPTPIIPPQLQRPIKMPAFMKPSPGPESLSNSTTNTPLSLSTSPVVKLENENSQIVPQRPKFHSGIRKPPAFQGLRKPGAFQRPDREKKKLDV